MGVTEIKKTKTRQKPKRERGTKNGSLTSQKETTHHQTPSQHIPLNQKRVATETRNQKHQGCAFVIVLLVSPPKFP